MSGMGGFLLGFAEGAVGSADKYLAEEREFDKKMTLQEWQHQKQVELAKLRDNLTRETEKWKLTDPDLKEERSLLRAEEQGYASALEGQRQAGAEERARISAEAAVESANTRSEGKFSETERENLRKQFEQELGGLLDRLPPDANWNDIRRLLKKENPNAINVYNSFLEGLRNAKTREQAVEIYDSFLDVVLSGGEPDKAPVSSQSWEERQAALRQKYQ